MDLLYPLVGGISAKVYDDILDNDIPANDIFKEALKGIQWITLALASVGDFNYTFMMYSMPFLQFFYNAEGFKLPYEYSLLLVYPIFLLSFHTIQYPSIVEFVLILIFLCLCYFEPIFFPEDKSYKKIISRILCLMSFLFIILFGKSFVSSSSRKLCAWNAGYALISCLFQFYMLQYKESKELEASKAEEPKASKTEESEASKAEESKASKTEAKE